MAALFVYDATENGFRTEAGEGWTDERLLAACRALKAEFPQARLARTYCPLAKGRYSAFSAHYAGLAADIEPPQGRLGEMRRWCVRSGLFSYVQPQYRSPRWVHAEVAAGPRASVLAGYPELSMGDAGAHAFVLQEALALLGLPCLKCGRFTEDTDAALSAFAQKNALPYAGVADAAIWSALFACLGISP